MCDIDMLPIIAPAQYSVEFKSEQKMTKLLEVFSDSSRKMRWEFHKQQIKNFNFFSAYYFLKIGGFLFFFLLISMINKLFSE